MRAAERGLICLFDDDRSNNLGTEGPRRFVGAGCVERERENVVLIEAAGAKQSVKAHDGLWLLPHLERRIDRS